MSPPLLRSHQLATACEATPRAWLRRVHDDRFAAACVLGAFGALLVDQLTKLRAEALYLRAAPSPSMAHHRASSELLVSVGAWDSTPARLCLEATHVANAGVMLGLLEEAPFGLGAVVFHATTLLALALASWLACTRSPSPRTLRCAAALLAAGVLSNLVDRIRLGYVIDWMCLHVRLANLQLLSPAFNLGDLLIVAGLTVAAAELTRRARLVVRAARGRLLTDENLPYT
jgi:signal peptidase II